MTTPNEPWPGVPVFVDDQDGDAISVRTASGQTVRLEDSLGEGLPGVFGAATHVGVGKPGVLDLGVVKLNAPATVSAVFTRNLCASPAVVFDRPVAAAGKVQLVGVVSKNANLFTPTATSDVNAVVDALAAEFGVDRRHVFVSFTGVIGVPLPAERVLGGIRGLSSKLGAGNLPAVSEAIMTTDKRPKVARIRIGDMVLCGMAKGAGMIEPNMATMLVYLYTNAALSKPDLDVMLKRAVDNTFNALSVDSDTSTSDTVALVSTGTHAMNGNDARDFEAALNAVCLRLCRKIAREAEGASKLLQVSVAVDTSAEDARFFAKKVVNSPLVKTAVYGSDPNWGRIVAALGKPTAGSPILGIDPAALVIRIAGATVYDGGRVVAATTSDVAAAMKRAQTIQIEAVIGRGVYRSTVWGCDLTPEYVVENSSYTS